MFNCLIGNDHTTDLIVFLKEDNDKNRKHNMEMFKLQLQSQIEMQLQMMRYFWGVQPRTAKSFSTFKYARH